MAGPYYEDVDGQTVDLLTETLTKNGAAIDLTGSTITVPLTPKNQSQTPTTLVMAISGSPASGNVTFDWSNGRPGPGDWTGRYKIVNGSETEFWPADGPPLLFRFWPAP